MKFESSDTSCGKVGGGVMMMDGTEGEEDKK